MRKFNSLSVIALFAVVAVMAMLMVGCTDQGNDAGAADNADTTPVNNISDGADTTPTDNNDGASDAPSINAADDIDVSSVDMECYNTAVSYISEAPHVKIDAQTIKLVSVTALNSLEDGSFYAYALDFCDSNDLYAFAVVNAETHTLIMFTECASPYFEYKQSASSQESESKQEFYYASFSYWVSDGNGMLKNLTDGTTAPAADVIGNKNSNS